MENKKNYFTTGEFAKLCGTTKATLFHYDEQGVLKPEITGENKYRYYSARQYMDFDLIQVLREAGSSLKEIKEYTQNHNPEAFVVMLKERRKQLELERKKLARMQRRLECAIELTEDALCRPREVVTIEEQPEEHLVAVSVDETVEGERSSETEISLMEEVQVIGELLNFCREKGLGEEFPLGSIVTGDDLRRGVYRDSFYYTRIQKPIAHRRYIRKPAGTYLTMLHQGNYDSVPEAMERMLQFEKENGAEIAGNAYIYDAIGYLAVGREEEFVVQISIQITGASSSPQ